MPRTNAAARTACRIAATLAAVALALPAQAQRARRSAPPAPAKSPPASTATTSAQTPASPGAGVAAAPEAAPARRGFFASRGPSSMALGVGAFSAEKASGLAVHLDYGFVRTPPSWRKLALEWRLRAMFAWPSEETDLTRTIPGVPPRTIAAGVEKTTVYAFEVGPLARVRLALGPKLAIFVDGGAGIAQTVEEYDRDEMYVGHTIEKQNVTAPYLGGALGLAYDPTERLRIMMLPLAFSAHLGSDYSAFLPALAVAYRL